MGDACTVVLVSVRKRILFLCNEPRLTRLVRLALEETGEYLIREEPDREVASEVAQKFQPDLILLDLTGEEVKGSEALEQFREDAALGDAPIIALESENGDAAIVFSSSLDGYECSAGPVDMDGLVHCVEEMLEQA
jgi:CheY-like chemotaxis protein